MFATIAATVGSILSVLFGTHKDKEGKIVRNYQFIFYFSKVIIFHT